MEKSCFSEEQIVEVLKETEEGRGDPSIDLMEAELSSRFPR